MKRITMFFIISMGTLLFMGCISQQQKAQQTWYGETVIQTYYLRPQIIKTNEEAISTIKLNEPNFRQWNGYEIVELNVDQYGLMMKTRWVTQETNYVTNPVNTSGFVGGNWYYDTTYVGKNETTTNSGIESYSFQFKNLVYLGLFFRSDIPNIYKWQVLLQEKNRRLDLRAKDKETALDLINAIYTLASRAGADIKMPRTGLSIFPITPQQKATIGVENLTGIVVSSIFIDSPAERCGLQINDIITKVNGQPLKTVVEFINITANNKQKKVKITVLRKSDFNKKTKVYDHSTFEQEILLK